MKGTILGILGILFALMLTGIASAEQSDKTNSRCHDTDRGIDPYVFGFVRAGSLYFEDTCFISDSGIALVYEHYCEDFDNWCYYAGVSRTIRYPSFEYAGYSIDVSEIGNDYAIFHILREGEDKEYRINVGEVKHTTHGIIIRLDNVEPEREGVVYSIGDEYTKTEAYLCTGGCYAGACIGNLTPMDVVPSSCRAPSSVNIVTPIATQENDTLPVDNLPVNDPLPANDTINIPTDALPNITITPANATLDPVNSTHDDKKDKKDKKVIKNKKTPHVVKVDNKIKVKDNKNVIKNISKQITPAVKLKTALKNVLIKKILTKNVTRQCGDMQQCMGIKKAK